MTDGFYVDASHKGNAASFSQDGLFLDCSADNGFRQGMSIINGDNIQVVGGAYTNTHGTRPAAGIDVEANSGSAQPGNHDILISGVKLTGNDGFGVQLSAKGDPSHITVEDSYFADNARGGIRLGSAKTLVENNQFENFHHSERGVIDLPAAQTNGHNVITGNSFDNIKTGQSVIFAHSHSGDQNQVYDNQFHDIAGSPVELKTTGAAEWDNSIGSGARPQPVTDLADDGDSASGALATHATGGSHESGAATADPTVPTADAGSDGSDAIAASAGGDHGGTAGTDLSASHDASTLPGDDDVGLLGLQHQATDAGQLGMS